MEKLALLVVDMQLGNFIGPEPIFNSELLLKNVKSLITNFREKNNPIVFIQNNGGQGDPDESGTKGWEIHPSLNFLENDFIIQKTTPDSFHDTILEEILVNLDVEHLFIVGLQTEFCIDTTCRKAFSLGYHVTLIEDAHSTWDSELLTAQQIINHHNSVLSGYFVELKALKEVLMMK